MKKLVIIIGLLSTFTSCVENKIENAEVFLLPKNAAAMQQRIISQLSGKTELANGIKLSSRWSLEEREFTRKYLKAIIDQLNLEPLENRYQQANINFGVDLLLEPFKGSNIYTILPATTESHDYIILGAHYDSGRKNAPGAIDNATGVALIYSVVKELQELRSRKQNVIMVFFDQEEEENVGSKAFIKLIKNNNWNITSVHCFDMIGWDGNNDEAIEIYTASQSLENRYMNISAIMDRKIFNLRINPVGYTNSSTDFDEFVREDFNVIGVGECYYHNDTTPFKDSIKDTFETVNFSYLFSATKFVEIVISDLLKN